MSAVCPSSLKEHWKESHSPMWPHSDACHLSKRQGVREREGHRKEQQRYPKNMKKAAQNWTLEPRWISAGGDTGVKF